ncbi:MAG: TetM/TetW/TetO/TetS family tetracycline resistance ribosomal protection protein [Lachnospiraceae bacterium]|nr:TetM/TetW/TetO/TetS family tetracycline resistance ribosomal protection protein [Lachnospiraceae bacterium]
MKKLSIGILAHVDAGKTTLTESILYRTGVIRTLGRVDNGDTYLDTESVEKKRGVTIYSKQAIVTLAHDHELNLSEEDIKITLIDTPGHVDFIGEAERSLSVLDLAVLLISAPDGVTDQTRRIKTMLEDRHIPYLVYVNKTDLCDEKRLADIIQSLKTDLNAGVIPVNDHIPTDNTEEIDNLISVDQIEDIASLSEDTIEKFLDTGHIDKEDISALIFSGKYHPAVFGSALRGNGTEELIKLITGYSMNPKYKEEFGAKVFKITYEDGHKISFMKITGGELAVRETLPDERLKDQKITQIRSYSGGRYTTSDKAGAGDVVALLGPEDCFVGMGIGAEPDETEPVNRPVLRYDMILPDDIPVRTFLPKLKELASQDPLLDICALSENAVSVSVMGEFQLEILSQTIAERFDIKVNFSTGRIIYKETIATPVIGFGHFEPLRHYAEIQLLIEPLPSGSGIEVGTMLNVSELGINWQKTVLSTLTKDLPTGVLTGSELTDLRFTIIGGRSHLKHSESTDFKEAVRRAVRQGLMKADCILLEPYYSFRISLPTECIGKAMNDIGMMNGTSSMISQDTDNAVIGGKAPARSIFNYQSTLTGYTSGRGHMSLELSGYEPCDEDYAQEVLDTCDYDPDSDPNNLSGSVFIDHGAGYYVPWYECEALMHVPSKEDEYLYGDVTTEQERLVREAEATAKATKQRELQRKGSLSEQLQSIGTDEIDEILRVASHNNAGSRKGNTKRVYHYKKVTAVSSSGKSSGGNGDDKYAKKTADKHTAVREKYLLVDGYNIIHAWDALKDLLTGDIYGLDGAKFRLLDILSEYRVLKNTQIIAVFDAYKVKGHVTERMDYMGVHVVYTAEAETADEYIAKYTVKNAKDLDIAVATSDALVQLIILGQNARLLSARELYEDIKRAKEL